MWPGRPVAGTPRRGQGGFSLAETLVAVAVASIWVLALVLGLLVVTTSDASSTARQALTSALAGTTEALKRVDYLECGSAPAADPAAYEAALASESDPYQPPAGVAVRLTAVQHWDPDAAGFDQDCPVADGGAQRISVEVTDGQGHLLTAQVVKARP